MYTEKKPSEEVRAEKVYVFLQRGYIMKTLRILFTTVSAVCIAAFVPVATLFGWGYAALCAAGAVCFFALMLLCKQNTENKKPDGNDARGDFLAAPPPEKKDKKD